MLQVKCDVYFDTLYSDNTPVTRVNGQSYQHNYGYGRIIVDIRKWETFASTCNTCE